MHPPVFSNTTQVVIVAETTVMNRSLDFQRLLVLCEAETRVHDFLRLPNLKELLPRPKEPAPGRRPELGPPPRLVRVYGARRRHGLSLPLLQFRAPQRDLRRLARQQRISSYSRKLAARLRAA